MKETDLKDKVKQEEFMKQHTLSQDEFLKLVKEKAERARFYSLSVRQRDTRALLAD